MVKNFLICGIIACAISLSGCGKQKIESKEEISKIILDIGQDDTVDDCFDYTYTYDVAMQELSQDLEGLSYSGDSVDVRMKYGEWRLEETKQHAPRLKQYERHIKKACPTTVEKLRSAASKIEGYAELTQAIEYCAGAVSDATDYINAAVPDGAWAPHGRALGPCPGNIYEIARNLGILKPAKAQSEANSAAVAAAQTESSNDESTNTSSTDGANESSAVVEDSDPIAKCEITNGQGMNYSGECFFKMFGGDGSFSLRRADGQDFKPGLKSINLKINGPGTGELYGTGPNGTSYGSASRSNEDRSCWQASGGASACVRG